MKSKSLRMAYGEALAELGAVNDKIIALDGDLGKSTFSWKFKEKFPNKFIEAGIAEQNLASLSAGLAFAGKIPFYSSFAVFATGRAYDQIRSSICIPNLNVNICGSSAGLSDYGDGKTHQSIDDIAIMQALPNMRVLVPADAGDVKAMIPAMAEHQGPCYIRVPRNEVPELPGNDDFAFGKMCCVQEGTDLAVFACGNMVSSALKSARELKKQGLSVKVLNMRSIKPFPREEVREIAKSIPRVLVVEEHNIIGGLGSCVFQAIAGLPGEIDHIGMLDCYGRSAENYEILLNHFELTEEFLTKRMQKMLSRELIPGKN